MDVTRTIRFEGNPSIASALVQFLKEEGVSVKWTPLDESRGLADDAVTVALSLLASGAYDGMKAAVRKFLQMFPHAKADIEEETVPEADTAQGDEEAEDQ